MVLCSCIWRYPCCLVDLVLWKDQSLEWSSSNHYIVQSAEVNKQLSILIHVPQTFCTYDELSACVVIEVAKYDNNVHLWSLNQHTLQLLIKATVRLLVCSICWCIVLNNGHLWNLEWNRALRILLLKGSYFNRRLLAFMVRMTETPFLWLSSSFGDPY